MLLGLCCLGLCHAHSDEVIFAGHHVRLRLMGSHQCCAPCCQLASHLPSLHAVQADNARQHVRHNRAAPGLQIIYGMLQTFAACCSVLNNKFAVGLDWQIKVSISPPAQSVMPLYAKDSCMTPASYTHASRQGRSPSCLPVRDNIGFLQNRPLILFYTGRQLGYPCLLPGMVGRWLGLLTSNTPSTMQQLPDWVSCLPHTAFAGTLQQSCTRSWLELTQARQVQ